VPQNPGVLRCHIEAGGCDCNCGVLWLHTDTRLFHTGRSHTARRRQQWQDAVGAPAWGVYRGAELCLGLAAGPREQSFCGSQSSRQAAQYARGPFLSMA